MIVTGTPGPMRAASQRIAVSATRTQPWETAVPRTPPTFDSPCRAICPGPPANSCRTLERALNASANGAPTSVDRNAIASSTKNWPVGVGVEGLPTIGPEDAHAATVAVDRHLPARGADDDVPVGDGTGRRDSADPARVSVRPSGEPHLEPSPFHPEHRKRGPLPGDRRRRRHQGERHRSDGGPRPCFVRTEQCDELLRRPHGRGCAARRRRARRGQCDERERGKSR